MIYVLLFSSAITLVLTMIQLYNDYRYDISLIDQRLAQIELSSLDSVSRNVWTLNHHALMLQLEGLLRLPDMTFLGVYSPRGDLVVGVGQIDSGNTVVKTYPVRHEYRGEMHELGTLRAVATLDNVYRRLWDTFVVILITQGIKTFLVSAFIVFIVARLITRHLVKLSEHVQSLDPRFPANDVCLDREPGELTSGDEFDQLVGAVNGMQRNMRRIYSDLAYSENMLERAQRLAHIGSWETDPDTGEVTWSNEVWSILQCKALGKGDGLESYIACAHADDREALRAGLGRAFETGQPLAIEHRVMCDDGTEKTVEFRAQMYLDESREEQRYIGTVHDVTDYCRQRDALSRLANYDSLTNLPNRWLLNTRIEQSIEAQRRLGGQFMLALMDLDGFKEVNDSLGHHAGDDLLRQLKPRLEGLLRGDDTLARLGGDEFAILLDPVEDTAQGVALVDAIIRATNQPFDLGIMQVKIGASVGMTLFPGHAEDGSTLLRYADVAMYHAKRHKLQHMVYTPEIDLHTPRRLELMSDMAGAIDNDQLLLHYQPKVSAADGNLYGVEALVRWQHPVHGFIAPDEFIPLCEIGNIICPLTHWVLQRALLDCRRWTDFGHAFGVSVNASVRNILDVRFPSTVIAALEQSGCSGDVLTLEITESALMENPARARVNIDQLHQLGVKISIDDFGTGYSSLAYLKHLKVQELKIDRGFVCDMLDDDNDAVIVKSTIDLAHSLGITVTAEGVETEAVNARLHEIGCDHVQGYLVARPMPFDALVAWLESSGTQANEQGAANTKQGSGR